MFSARRLVLSHLFFLSPSFSNELTLYFPHIARDQDYTASAE